MHPFFKKPEENSFFDENYVLPLRLIQLRIYFAFPHFSFEGNVSELIYNGCLVGTLDVNRNTKRELKRVETLTSFWSFVMFEIIFDLSLELVQHIL